MNGRVPRLTCALPFCGWVPQIWGKRPGPVLSAAIWRPRRCSISVGPACSSPSLTPAVINGMSAAPGTAARCDAIKQAPGAATLESLGHRRKEGWGEVDGGSNGNDLVSHWHVVPGGPGHPAAGGGGDGDGGGWLCRKLMIWSPSGPPGGRATLESLGHGRREQVERCGSGCGGREWEPDSWWGLRGRRVRPRDDVMAKFVAMSQEAGALRPCAPAPASSRTLEP
jgi:hypothetical protein